MSQDNEPHKIGKRGRVHPLAPKKKTPNKAQDRRQTVDANKQEPDEAFTNTSYGYESFTFNKPIYLQININKLLSIFTRALIAPSRYYDNDQYHDVQSKSSHYLTLSNYLLEPTTKETALVEVSIPKFEVSYFFKTEHILLSHLPFPISRIKAIYLHSETEKQKIINTASIGDAGIIPENLIRGNFPTSLYVVPIDFPLPILGDLDHSSRLQRYDQILGAYAYVQNVPLILSGRNRLVRNYSNQFLGFVNLILSGKIGDADIAARHTGFFRHLLRTSTEKNDTLDWIVDRASTQVNLTDQDILDFADFFLRGHQDKIFIEKGKIALQMLMNGIERKRAPAYILSIEHIDRLYLYLFAFLYIYGNRSSEDRSNARLSIPHEVRTQNAEMVFSLLGYFYGYSLLRNYEEKFDFGDSEAALSILRKPINLKFGLNSYFEYCLIDAVYMLVFDEDKLNINSAFEHIDYESINPGESKKVSLPHRTFVKTTELLGKHLFAFNNIEAEKMISEVRNLPDTIPIISEVGIFCLNSSLKLDFELNKLLHGSSDPSQLRDFATFKKSDLIDYIIFGSGSIADLEARIKMQLNVRP